MGKDVMKKMQFVIKQVSISAFQRCYRQKQGTNIRKHIINRGYE